MKFRYFILLYFIFTAPFPSCQDNLEEDIVDDTPEIPQANVLLSNAGCPDSLSPIYFETEGILSIEIESSDFKNSQWQIDSTISNASNDKYLVWMGTNYFNQPGKGILTFKIAIENPGTYRFLWRSRITSGDSNTEHNDSWLRIPDAAHFYGKKNDHIVYPHGSTLPPIDASIGQTDTKPAGSGSKGWFKIYMNSLGAWKWSSRTSDHDPHDIFAVFDAAGVYTIEISGRSKFHGLDRLVLFKGDFNLVEATANNRERSMATCR